MTTLIHASDIKLGDVINFGLGPAWLITELHPYHGPFENIGCVGIAKGKGSGWAEIGVTLWTQHLYERIDNAQAQASPGSR